MHDALLWWTDVADNDCKAEHGHKWQCVNGCQCDIEWPLTAVLNRDEDPIDLSGRYKPSRLPGCGVSSDSIPPPNFTPLTVTPTLFHFPLPCVRNALYAPDSLGYDISPIHAYPFLHSTLLPPPSTTTHYLYLINPDHHVDPQEQRPGVFFAQRFREFFRTVRI